MKEFYNKNKIAVNITIVVVVLIFAYYFLTRSPKQPKTDLNIPGSSDPNPNGSEMPGVKTGNDDFPLHQGSYGNNVKYLQNAINKIRPSAPIKVDQDFGAGTYNALLLSVGTTIPVGGVSVASYPVTLPVFNAILHKANNPVKV